MAASSWRAWLQAPDAGPRGAFLLRAFAHTITARPVARDAQIPGTCGWTWGDAESDGFLILTGAWPLASPVSFSIRSTLNPLELHLSRMQINNEQLQSS
jgi:hypothetical protein